MKKVTMLDIKVITLFPEFIEHYAQFGIIKRAITKKLLRWQAIDLRKFGLSARKTVDDRPYGGGVGMVLRPDVLHTAICVASKSTKLHKTKYKHTSKDKSPTSKQRVILLTPSGRRFVQKDAVRLAKYDRLIFVSARYEGYDERIAKFVDEELSIGDYVLMGGELPALVVAEAVLRHIPGVLGKSESADFESFSGPILEHPQYTKPELWTPKPSKFTGKKVRNLSVPKVLLTGHHGNIEAWRKQTALKRTKKFRPDLLSA